MIRKTHTLLLASCLSLATVAGCYLQEEAAYLEDTDSSRGTDATCTPSIAETGDACFDGVDNDCDDLIDAFDPDCSEGQTTTTSSDPGFDDGDPTTTTSDPGDDPPSGEGGSGGEDVAEGGSDASGGAGGAD